jgi:hypothetical protein
VGRPRLQFLKQIARNTGTGGYKKMERMACNKSIWKAANQSEDRGIRRRRRRKCFRVSNYNNLTQELQCLVRKPEGKRPLGILWLRWENNIKMDL